MSGCRDNFLPISSPPFLSGCKKKCEKKYGRKRNHRIRETKKRNRKDLSRGSNFESSKKTIVFLARVDYSQFLGPLSRVKREFKFVFIYFYEKCTKTASGECQMSSEKCKIFSSSLVCKSNFDFIHRKI